MGRRAHLEVLRIAPRLAIAVPHRGPVPAPVGARSTSTMWSSARRAAPQPIGDRVGMPALRDFAHVGKIPRPVLGNVLSSTLTWINCWRCARWCYRPDGRAVRAPRRDHRLMIRSPSTLLRVNTVCPRGQSSLPVSRSGGQECSTRRFHFAGLLANRSLQCVTV